MSTFRRIAFISLGALGGLAAIVLGSFFFYRWSHAGEVLGAVEVSGVQLSGLSATEALAEVLSLEDGLASTSASFRVNGSEFELPPPTVGFDVDADSIVSGAMSVGREAGVLSQFMWWLGSFGQVYSLPLVGSIDPEALDQVIDEWEAGSGLNVPFHGAITLEGAVPEARYPEPGLGIDRTGLPQLVLQVLLQEERPVTDVNVQVLEPLLTVADIDRALARARKMLSGPVTLTRDDPEVTVVFSLDQLADAFYAEVVEQSSALIELGFDVGVIDAYLDTIREDLEAPPRDAEFVVDENDTITILPSRPGTLVDAQLAVEAVTEAAATFARVGEFPFEDGAEPQVTTQDLEALGVQHLVSAFTTYHECCQDRVHNIHLIADEIDGALIRPGESFSVNEYVGKRTAAEGYRMAGTIIDGELVDTVGGGVSQFATTFYGAVFWGGYEDVEHKPHSLYFSRYPEGIEATISWPAPNLIFRNNTEAAVLIKTEYTDTSITVKFYGSNGGRTVVGEQKGGKTLVREVSEGADARIVTAELSPRYGYRESTVKYVADPTLEPGQEVVERRGGSGWSVDVTRIIRSPDGSETRNFWTVRYSPPFRVLRVHPCMIPEGFDGHTGEECPEPTTTVPSTTVPEPGETTTTTPP